MSDKECIPALIAIGGNSSSLESCQHDAAAKLLRDENLVYPMDGCAITLSCLLQSAGIDVPDTFLALSMVSVLESRGWQKIPVGEQKAGDVGTTCYGGVRHPGVDHVYLILRDMNEDECVVADNQRSCPHFRSMSGHPDGKSPTRVVLRAM